MTTPVDSNGRRASWQVKSYGQWEAVDATMSEWLEGVFRNGAKTSDKGGDTFNADAMLLNDNPVRRVSEDDDVENQFEYWEDDGVWTEYIPGVNAHLLACEKYGRKNTAFYHMDSAYDVDLEAMIQYNRQTTRPRPMRMHGPTSCDDDTQALEVPDNVTVPDEYNCPIGLNFMQHPVIAADGHTYERCNIAKHILTKSTSPLTNKALRHKHLVTNHALRKVMIAWLDSHKKSPSDKKKRTRPS